MSIGFCYISFLVHQRCCRYKTDVLNLQSISLCGLRNSVWFDPMLFACVATEPPNSVQFCKVMSHIMYIYLALILKVKCIDVYQKSSFTEESVPGLFTNEVPTELTI